MRTLSLAVCALAFPVALAVVLVFLIVAAVLATGGIGVMLAAAASAVGLMLGMTLPEAIGDVAWVRRKL